MKKITTFITSIIFLSQMLTGQCNLTCNDLVNVSLSETGYAIITWDMVTEGTIAPCNPEDLVVSLEDNNGNTLLEPIVDRTHHQDTLLATVTNVDGTSCWGRIVVEDKLNQNCNDSLNIELVTTEMAGQMITSFVVKDFINISSMQFSIRYDETKLKYTGVANSNLEGLNASSFNDSPIGSIKMLWFDPNASSVTLDDNTSVFDLNFDILSGGENIMYLSSFPLEIEISNNNGELLCLNSKPEIIANNGVTGECAMVCKQTVIGNLTTESEIKLFAQNFLENFVGNCDLQNTLITVTDENGNTTTGASSIDLTAAGEYDYNIEDQASGVNCSGLLIIQESNDNCILACNSLVQVSLASNGEAEITWQMMTEGNLPGCDTEELSVLLTDEDGNTIDPPIATNAHVGQTLIATVTEASSGTSCWGEVLIENKLCELNCIPLLTALMPPSGELVVYSEDFIDEQANCDYSQLDLVLVDQFGITYTGTDFVTLTQTGDYQVQVNDQITGTSCSGTLRVLGENTTACSDTLQLELVASQVGDEVVLELISTNFINIQTAQFSISYEQSVLNYVSTESSLPMFTDGNINSNIPGKLGVVWFDQTGVTPYSNQDGTVLMTIRFNAFNDDNVNFAITNDPVSIEFTDDQGIYYCLDTQNIDVSVSGTAQPCTLSCNDKVNVSVPQNGSIEVTADMLLEGGPYSQCGSFEVEITDGNGNLIPSSPFINYSSSTQEYGYTVTQVSTGNSCWGTIKAKSFDQGGCVDTLYLDLVSVFDGEKVRLDVKAYNFNEIVSMQFAINFDETVLEYETLTESVLPGVFASSANAIGSDVLFAWNDPNVAGVTIADGTTIMSFSFSALQNANTSFAIGETNWLQIEIVNADFQLLCLADDSSEVLIDGAHYYGYVVFDENLDCTRDSNESGLNDWFISLDNGVDVYNFDTDENGYYSMVVPAGNYTLSAHAPNDLWTFCDNDIEAITMSNDEFYNYDFLALPQEDCPYMTVDISTPFLRRCFDNKYFIKYCNKGTLPSVDSKVTVTLDDNMTFTSTGFIDHVVNGQIIDFNLGDIGIGECGTISFIAKVSCDVDLGQTHCTEARVFPEPECLGLFSSWDGPNVEVEGTCETDSVRFVIKNTGSNPMIESSSFIVIEDDVMFPIKDFQLEPQEEIAVAYPNNGSTYRVRAYQVTGHPSEILPTLAIEGCGINNQGDFSTGFVNMFENGDGDESIDIDCQENIGSFDPNDKVPFPAGYRSENLIYNDTKLEYKIRFQNTGTDTAFRVVIKDTLSEKLDLISIELGSASHPYTFSLEDSRILVFTFDNIKLVSEKEDEINSHGFVKYKINQVEGNTDGTKIYNKADIYFDFNDPVLTNETVHTVGTDFVQTLVSTINIEDPNVELSIYPNPFRDYANLEIRYIKLRQAQIVIYNILGQELKQFDIVAQNTSLDLGDLSEGNYFFRIENNGQLVATGKISRQ